MRQLSRNELTTLLQYNVCEIQFVRRRPERSPGKSLIRGMLCCNSMNLLNTTNGVLSLNFHLPRGPKKIDEIKHNIVVAWDIMMQDYRNISMDSCLLVQQIPANDSFWKYFEQHLHAMPSATKEAFDNNSFTLTPWIEQPQNGQTGTAT